MQYPDDLPTAKIGYPSPSTPELLSQRRSGQQHHDLAATTSTQPPTVIIIGMRGTGKSTLGARAAQALSLRFVDIDKTLSTQFQQPLPELIRTRGWVAFRQLELQTMKSVITHQPTGLVVACGGGIVESKEARKMLAEYAAGPGIVLHLRREEEKLIGFLRRDGSRTALREDPATVWERRRGWYKECTGLEYQCVDDGTGFAEERIGELFCEFMRDLLQLR